MKTRCHTFGPTTVARLCDPHELPHLLDDPLLKRDSVIVKPNWVSTDPGDFTDAATLRCLLEALPGRAVITESYCLARSLNLRPNGLPFVAAGKQVDWRWLLKGEGWRWLVAHPDWAWFRNGEHWAHLAMEERAFLEQYGFSELFEEFDVTYVNVTEEVWQGRIANRDAVKRAVEAKYAPVHDEQLYAMVPARLFELRGAPLISFARLKMYASFTLKNLFGMIPDPLRPYWHGPQDRTIAQSIVDVNKVYHALFQPFGLCEALFSQPLIHPEGHYEGIYSGRYNLRPGPGCVAFGRDLVALDSLLLELTDPAIRGIAPVNSESVLLAERELDLPVDRDPFESARAHVGHWISPVAVEV